MAASQPRLSSGGSAYETGTGDVASAAGRAAAEGSGVRVPPHEVRGQLLKCVWASQRQHVIVALNRRDLGVGSSSWSLLLNLHRVSEFFCARELIVSGS